MKMILSSTHALQQKSLRKNKMDKNNPHIIKQKISFKKIVTGFSQHDSMWLEALKKHYEPEAQFLLLIAPFITYVYLAVEKISVHQFSFPSEERKAIVLKKFKENWLQKLLMCCVLELNDAKELNLLQGETPEARFTYFIYLLGDFNNRVAFFEKYPVLKEKLCQFVSQEITVFNELLTRLNKSFLELCTVLSWKKDDYTLKNIIASGDSHGGRNVCILHFVNSLGEKRSVVYKPRSLLMDKAYHEFLDWLNPFLSKPLHAPKLLLKKEYGLCEFISNIPCKNLREIKEYYTSLGNLLAVLYLLCGSDIHYENIIAYGKQPVIIDVECLFVPHNILKQDFMPFQEKMFSVLNTLLLPCRVMVKKDSPGMDISGFSAHESQPIPYQGIVVENSGTDNIKLVRKTLFSTKKTNVPKILENPVDPMDYEKCFVNGFVEAYHILLNKKKLLLSSINSPLRSFKQARTRLVFRPTVEYAKLLMECYHPTLLCDKKSYRKHFSQWLIQKKLLKNIYPSEMSQILQGDIPAFFSKVISHSHLVDANNEKVNMKFEMSGYQQVMDHIRNDINANDFEAQSTFIKQSFHCCKINTSRKNQENLTSRNLNITKKEVVPVIKNLLEDIRQSVWKRDKLLFWPQAFPTYKIWNVGVTSLWLYDGLAGIALTFAYATDFFKEKKYKALVLDSLEHVSLMLNEFSKQKQFVPIGAFSGLGGVLHLCQALKNLKTTYKTQKILEQCFSLLEKNFDVKNKNNFFGLDIISGVAGLLKVLLSFIDTLFEKRALNIAKSCVKWILHQYPEPGIFTEKMNEIHANVKPLLGFSHGICGIAWSLFHYYSKVRQSEKIRIWIEKALQYERDYFSQEHQNWPHFEEDAATADKQYNYPVKWCHGAVGIGLSRLDMYNHGWRDPFILDEIQFAIKATLIAPVPSQLNLCHGALGNLEFLFLAKQNKFLTEEEYKKYTESIVLLVDNKKIIVEIDKDLFIPGLMTGKSGIAYALMRILNTRISSVLLLDNNKK